MLNEILQRLLSAVFFSAACNLYLELEHFSFSHLVIAFLSFVLQMITEAEKSPLGMQLISIQKLFSLVFPVGGRKDEALPSQTVTADAEPPINEHIPSQSSEFIDLSSCMQNTEVLLPTLNG